MPSGPKKRRAQKKKKEEESKGKADNDPAIQKEADVVLADPTADLPEGELTAEMLQNDPAVQIEPTADLPEDNSRAKQNKGDFAAFVGLTEPTDDKNFRVIPETKVAAEIFDLKGAENETPKTSPAGETDVVEKDKYAVQEEDVEKEEQVVATLNDEDSKVNKGDAEAVEEVDAEKNQEAVALTDEAAIAKDHDAVKENEQAATQKEEVEDVDTNQEVATPIALVANVTDKIVSGEISSYVFEQLQQIKEMSESGLLLAGKVRELAVVGLKIVDNFREMAEVQLELAGDVGELFHEVLNHANAIQIA